MLQGWRVVAVAVVATGLLALPAGAGTGAPDIPDPADTLSVVKGDSTPSNVDLAVLLSQATPQQVPVQRVLVGRDDAFADALASGALQGDAPLLLVPPRGPIPEAVDAELDRLQPREALVLGGTAAVDPVVVENLLDRDIAVRRRAGGTRIETAVAIAEELPGATTAMLARAFASPQSEDPSQAFADALAAGGLAAREARPVLLTESDRLSGATAAYLARSAITTVQVVGGTAAISQAVVEELEDLGMTVQRVAGASRAETAIAIADLAGQASASDADRVVLVEGFGPDAWAGGFAAAGHAAAFEAPIVLAAGDDLPPATSAFLDGGAADADADDVVITCVSRPFTCEQSRRALGLPAVPYLFLTPESGSPVDDGQEVTLTIDPPEAGDDAIVRLEDTGRFGGGCFPTTDPVTLVDGQATLTLLDPLPQGGCETFLISQVDGTPTAFALASYLPGDLVPEDFAALFVRAGVGGDLAPEVTVGVDVAATCTAPDGTTATQQGRALAAVSPSTGIPVLAPLRGLTMTRYDACEVTASLPPGVVEPVWGTFSFLDTTFANPFFQGVGATARFDLADLDAQVNGFSTLFVTRLTDPRPVAPPLPAQPTADIYRLFTGVAVSCDDGTEIVPDDEGDSFVPVPDGTTCTAEATRPGTLLVGQANRAPQEGRPGTEVTFTVDSTLGPTLVWNILEE